MALAGAGPGLAIRNGPLAMLLPGTCSSPSRAGQLSLDVSGHH